MAVLGGAYADKTCVQMRHVHGENLGEQRFAGVCQANDLAATVAVMRDTLDPAVINQAVDHTCERALGNQRFLAKLGGGHPRRVAECSDDVELRRRQPQCTDVCGRIGLERLVALHQGLNGLKECGVLAHWTPI